MLAASLYIIFYRRSSHSIRELQFISLLDTISSSCAQCSSFALPQAIGVFTLKPSRSLVIQGARQCNDKFSVKMVLSLIALSHQLYLEKAIS